SRMAEKRISTIEKPIAPPKPYRVDSQKLWVLLMFMEKTSPLLYRILGVFLPLITVNCALLGVALLNINKTHSFWESTLYGFGGAVGFSIVLILFSAMRERLAVADVPVPFKGAAIGMITAGLMSLAFMGFSGLV